MDRAGLAPKIRIVKMAVSVMDFMYSPCCYYESPSPGTKRFSTIAEPDPQRKP
jgi:hypothetical protein